MGDKSGIQWTDATWNPVTGCDKVSPGCANCYAETVADRFWAKQYPWVSEPSQTGGLTADADVVERPRRFTDVWCHEDRLDQPLRWKRPRKIFVNSMSDLFHEDVPEVFIMDVFRTMMQAKQHTFQVLTKRAERMRDVVGRLGGQHWVDEPPWPLPNVWMGVSVENQHFADERLPLLMDTPAAVRFVSYEPALGPVDFMDWLDHECGAPPHSRCPAELDWIIIGGESGRGARPFNLAWARNTIRDCKAAGVPVFMKQFGAMPYEGTSPFASGPDAANCRPYELDIDKGHGGDWVEWPEDLRIREFPKVVA